MRTNVVYAVTWRILAELLRRHHARDDLQLYWYFPGNSRNGIVVLRRPGGEVVLELNVAHAHVCGAAVRDERTHAYVEALLSASDPKTVIDALGAQAGLAPVAGPLLADTSAVLCARVIAALLERNMLARSTLRTSPGYFDQNGVHALDWAVQIAGVAEQLARLRGASDSLDESPLVQHLFALHRGDEVLGYVGPQEPPFVALDPRTGVAHAVHGGGRARSTLALGEAYRASGGRLRPLVDWTETWL